MNGIAEEVERLKFSLHVDRFPGICTGLDIYYRSPSPKGMQMKLDSVKPSHDIILDTDSIINLISATQLYTGEIPWHIDGRTDPWDHVESAIGLSIGGRIPEAQRAFEWMARMQLPDGSWYSSYKNGMPTDRSRDTNLAAYIAVGVFYHFLITKDMTVLREMWNTIYSAIEFSLSLQTPEGEIYWAISPEGHIDQMSLLTGCSSICMSLKCAMAISEILGQRIPAWKSRLKKLQNAIANKPYRFNMTKSRFSMDWFYPILCGTISGEKAGKRISSYWKKYIIEDQGVRCVYDEPWVTIAETSELVLTLSAMGNHTLAEIVFSWLSNKKFNDGTFWCGFTFPDMIIWPVEKVTWTNAVVLMAADSIFNLTPAARLFSHHSWKSDQFIS